MAVELMGVLIAFQLRSQQPHKLDVLAALFIIQEACIVRLEKFEQHIRPAWFNLSQLQTSGRKLTGDLGFSLYACHIIWETLLNIARNWTAAAFTFGDVVSVQGARSEWLTHSFE